jgi:hypothetical protein
MAKKKEDRNDVGGLFIPAGIFIGLGLGFLWNNIPGGLFLGLGAGFVAFAITKTAMPCCRSK